MVPPNYEGRDEAEAHTDQHPLPIGAAREHPERVGAAKSAAEEAGELDRNVQERIDAEAREQQGEADADHARYDRDPLGEPDAGGRIRFFR